MAKPAGWGGARAGSGPAPQSATLRLGNRIAISERREGGMLPLVGGTVAEIKRGSPRIVVLAMDDGSEIRMMIG